MVLQGTVSLWLNCSHLRHIKPMTRGGKKPKRCEPLVVPCLPPNKEGWPPALGGWHTSIMNENTVINYCLKPLTYFLCSLSTDVWGLELVAAVPFKRKLRVCVILGFEAFVFCWSTLQFAAVVTADLLVQPLFKTMHYIILFSFSFCPLLGKLRLHTLPTGLISLLSAI